MGYGCISKEGEISHLSEPVIKQLAKEIGEEYFSQSTLGFSRLLNTGQILLCVWQSYEERVTTLEALSKLKPLVRPHTTPTLPAAPVFQSSEHSLHESTLLT